MVTKVVTRESEAVPGDREPSRRAARAVRPGAAGAQRPAATQTSTTPRSPGRWYRERHRPRTAGNAVQVPHGRLSSRTGSPHMRGFLGPWSAWAICGHGRRVVVTRWSPSALGAEAIACPRPLISTWAFPQTPREGEGRASLDRDAPDVLFTMPAPASAGVRVDVVPPLGLRPISHRLCRTVAGAACGHRRTFSMLLGWTCL